MYLIKNNSNLRSEILPLRDVLSRFLKENEITDSAIAEEVGVTRATLSKFLKGESELKFMQADWDWRKASISFFLLIGRRISIRRLISLT